MLTTVFYTCLTLFVCFSGHCLGESFLELTEDNFDDTLKRYDLVLVKFYAEWCGHCKRMAPEFAKAADLLKTNEPPVILAKLNCPNHQKVCEKYGVTGYPTLKIFKRGVFSEDYTGGRDSHHFVSFMKSRAGPASMLLKTEDEIQKLLLGSTSTFIAYVPNEEDTLFKNFFSVADSMRDRFNFGHIISKSKTIKRFLPKKIQTKMEDAFVETSVNNQDEIRMWINENWGGHLRWSDDNHELFSGLAHPSVTIAFELDYENDPKGTNYVRNRLLKAIKELNKERVKSKFAMTSIINNQEGFKEKFGLDWKKGDKPVVVAMYNKKKYVMEGEFSYDNLKKFVKELEAGKLEDYTKSEPISASETDVVKVVAKNFDDIVRDTTKNVLIEFYAPWCGHCNKLKPIYEELAKKLKGESDIVIAAIDATANDVPEDFTVSGFPTLFWVEKGEKSLYEGGRELNDFIKFIEGKLKRSLEIKKDEL